MSGRIAVTGANGFVGRNLVRHAAAAGWRVDGIVRSDAAARVVAAAGGRPASIVERDPEVLVGALEGVDAVIHLAQIGAERGGQTYEAVNVGLTERVLGAARAAGVGRVVYFSGLGVSHYGQRPRCTNRYFLSKITAETMLFRSGVEVTVFRPSYVVGAGDAFLPALLAAMEAGEIERPGDGTYRLQPIAVSDAVALVLAAVERPAGAFPTVFDLVGPEPLTYAAFLDRLGRAAGRGPLSVRDVPIEEADRRARAGGYHGMLPDELDCMLCDEVSNPSPLVALLGRPLLPLDQALAAAVFRV